MNLIKSIFLLLFICCFPILVSAQISIDDSQNADQLVKVLTNNNSCISIYPATASGSPIKKSFATFNKNGSNFPFASGIVLSTWESENSKGPYNPGFSGSVASWNGDSNMDTILSINSLNATSLEFEFESLTNFLSFNYIFASNEYIRDYPCNYSDGLAILIKDITTNGNYINIATLPDGTPVSSKNIHPAINTTDPSLSKCDAKNEAYFGQFNTDLAIASPINYAAQTKVLNAQSKLEIGHRYKIKLVIAEDRSRAQFSAVFVEAGSFTSKIDLGANRLLTTNNALCFGENFVLNTGLTGLHQWSKTNASGTTTLPETGNNLTINQEGTYKVEVTDIATSCTYTGEIKVEYLPSLALTNATLSKCDDNGTGNAFFDLTLVKSILTHNASDILLDYYQDSSLNTIISSPTAFEKTIFNDQIVYVKGTNTKGCSEIATITLKTLASSLNPSTLPTPIIKGFAGKENSVELIAPTTAGNYEFSIDGSHYQDNPIFTGLTKGDYTAYIRDTSSCEYATYTFTILDYPTFFTPNGDGLNEVWKIDGLNQYTQAVIYIFDRYGKLLKQMDSRSVGWNGTFKGILLPADDYWFRLVLNDTQIVNGHFSLKK